MTDASNFYVIDRIDGPRWMATGTPVDHDPWDELTGEQAEWGWAIPLLYQVLASKGEPPLSTGSR